jgi:hypothetical protein
LCREQRIAEWTGVWESAVGRQAPVRRQKGGRAMTVRKLLLMACVGVSALAMTSVPQSARADDDDWEDRWEDGWRYPVVWGGYYAPVRYYSAPVRYRYAAPMTYYRPVYYSAAPVYYTPAAPVYYTPTVYQSVAPGGWWYVSY